MLVNGFSFPMIGIRSLPEILNVSRELEIRRKSNGEPLDNLEIPSDAIRKGPAMPSADVLAVLAQREVVIPEVDTEHAEKAEDAQSLPQGRREVTKILHKVIYRKIPQKRTRPNNHQIRISPTLKHQLSQGDSKLQDCLLPPQTNPTQTNPLRQRTRQNRERRIK